ncbi:class I SAM-dependent methyltransferase [Helicobacter sp. 12S02634-8]|uniref:class I SAM-dependent methyltransferase n=1 Tax=Helicobacter sp. 12S02634-8 TaxID=1476199 RepID=UPI00155679FE|nr:class I SAM-dependent methyltransferase [Helicobacter sp. 12S02634-8]
MPNIWDQKSKNFPGFCLEDTESMQILDYFKEQGICWRGKNVLDIGCGSGRYALRFAQEAKKVYATDISAGMIERLLRDVDSYGYRNIIASCEPWEEYDPKSPIDIAFASMTPALSNFKAFQKAFTLAKEALAYVGWGRKRESAFLQKVFKAHHIQLELPTGAPDVMQFLAQMGKHPKVSYIQKTKIYRNSLDNAINDIAWHISIHQAVPNKELIHTLIKEEIARTNQTDDTFSYSTQMEIGLIALIK